MSTSTRQAGFAIDPQFTRRWSPRAFADEAISKETLLSFFEAARWAPSAYNFQPWRFIYAIKGGPGWQPLLESLIPFNQGWAKNAAALVAIVSANTGTPPGGQAPQPIGSHSFDAGAAWGYLALQASLAGWAAHGMTGLDQDAVRRAIGLPGDYTVEAIAAIGRPGDKNTLPDGLRDRETPSPRKPLAEIAAEGKFSF